MKPAVTTRYLIVVLLGTWVSQDHLTQAAQPNRGPVWTQFEMNRPNADGDYLWTTPENWTKGLPSDDLAVEIGDDHSGQALHCVIPEGVNAACSHFELAEHARTQGTTLRLRKGATFTIQETGVLSKDRESWFYVDGVFRCTKPQGGLRVGGPWGRPDLGEPASCHLMIGPAGIVDAWFVGINTTYRAESTPSSPWGPKFFARSTDSEIVVDGGKLSVQEGLRMSTTDCERPGALRLKGKARFTCPSEASYGIEVWCGVWEIDGGDADIRVGDIEFSGNKFEGAVNTRTRERLGAGKAVLKLTGSGVSTIHARRVNFVDAAVLDVSGLKVTPGAYTVIDGTEITGTNLQLAPGTNPSCSLRFDRAEGNVILTFRP